MYIHVTAQYVLLSHIGCVDIAVLFKYSNCER